MTPLAGIFFLVLGLLLVVFPDWYARSTAAFWSGLVEEESHRARVARMTVPVGIVFIVTGCLMVIGVLK